MKKYYYKFIYNDAEYIIGFYTVLQEQQYDYVCNENEYLPSDLAEGWYKFKPTIKGQGAFILDKGQKAIIEQERERRRQQPTQMDIIEAQTVYTALMTDTLIEGE